MSLWVAVGWVICGWLGYGVTFAYLTGEFPDVEPWRYDASFALFIALCGPVGLLVVFLMSGFAFHGIRWRPTRKEREFAKRCRDGSVR